MINKRISLEKCVESGRNSAVILMSLIVLHCYFALCNRWTFH